MADLENQVDALRGQVERLEQLVERLLARPVEGAAAAVRIATVKLTGTTGRLQDYDGSAYVDAPIPSGGVVGDVQITVKPAGGAFAIWRELANEWELLSTAGFITFTTASALLASDTSQASCPVVLVWEGTNPGATVTVYNELGWEADAGVDGYAKYCAADGKWKIIVIPCPAGSS